MGYVMNICRKAVCNVGDMVTVTNADNKHVIGKIKKIHNTGIVVSADNEEGGVYVDFEDIKICNGITVGSGAVRAIEV